MNSRFNIPELFMLAALVLVSLATAAVAGPPPPPVVSAPATPVGGTEITFATAGVIAGYGYWKSRK